MHIKRVVIKGFKSYASQLDVEEFDSGSNVIVGKNGAGKSNFIDAIRFVLASDKFQRKLPTEERRTLLHSGAGGATLLGYVEIEFDNSDKRLPIDSTEVILRRDIGLKKDDYTLNGKRAELSDILSLLESAGFSRSNPYYIVMQGQVAQITKMSPAERLELLKEVAGTRVYDERRAESLKIMKETESKKEKINEVMDLLDERLQELEAEKQELSEYRELDRERRALEYVIYQHQHQECLQKLASVDEARIEESNTVAQKYTELDALRAQIKETEAELADVTHSLTSFAAEREALFEEQRGLISRKATVELELGGRESAMKLAATSKTGVTKQLKQLAAEIKTSHEKLAKIQKEFEKATDDERKFSEELMTADNRMKDLLSRAGRQRQFKTAKERDAWLKKEIADLKAQIKKSQKESDELKTRIKEAEQRRDEDQKLVATRASGLEERKKMLAEASATYEELRDKRDKLNSTRKELWREESEIDRSIQKHTEVLRKAERRLQATMSKDVSTALTTIERLKSEGLANGVYGPLIELFDCEDKFLTAVEVAAGNSLFHVVVDTDTTAAGLVNTLNDEKAGRVTFIPLNRLEVKDSSFNGTDQVKPLVEVLDFKTTFEKAFMQIFGKVLLCGSIEVASSVSRMNKMTCITLDGDQVSHRGAWTGGFYDPNSSRLGAYREVKHYKALIVDAKQKRDELRGRISQLEQRINEIATEVTEADSDRIKAREELEQFDSSSRAAGKHQLKSEEAIVLTKRALDELTVSIQTLKEAQASMESEVGTPLGGLSDDERAELQDLSSKVPGLRQQREDVAHRRAELEAQKVELENSLGNNLLRKQDELEKALASGQLPDVDDAAHLRSDLDQVEEELEKISTKLAKISSDNEKAIKKEEELKEKLETLAAAEDKAASDVDAESRSMDKLMNKRVMLSQKRDEAAKKLREVGSLPADLTAQYADKSSAECLLLLHSTNQKLKGYSHVNKKALDQYTSFTDQREALVERKRELDESEAAIANLVDTLDHHKDEAIERTVKGVSKYFSEIFEELTSGGKASLVKLIREATSDQPAEVKGIEIRVAFQPGREQKMSQLSGGQASIVALSLIFAIQRCDPAPFYVFDEIDPALDDSHRQAVARMIQKACEPRTIQRVEGEEVINEVQQTQFIMTTHRPELIEIADKHYKITFSNRKSQVETVGRNEALEVIRPSDSDEMDSAGNDISAISAAEESRDQ